MQRTSVTSSNVKSVGWENGTLEVEFVSGIYQYADVPAETYSALMEAPSVGRYLNAQIKDRYTATKVS